MNNRSFKTTEGYIITMFCTIQLWHRKAKSSPFTFLCHIIDNHTTRITKPIKFCNLIKCFTNRIINSCSHNFNIIKAGNFTYNTVTTRNQKTDIRIRNIICKMRSIQMSKHMIYRNKWLVQ